MEADTYRIERLVVEVTSADSASRQRCLPHVATHPRAPSALIFVAAIGGSSYTFACAMPAETVIPGPAYPRAMNADEFGFYVKRSSDSPCLPSPAPPGMPADRPLLTLAGDLVSGGNVSLSRQPTRSSRECQL
jgi:hypothetical protein